MSIPNIKPGDPLPTKATTWNAILGAAREHLARNGGGSPLEAAGGMAIENTSGTDVDRFGVLGVDGLVFAPADDLDAFQAGFALTGVTPSDSDHLGKFAICLEPIAAGEIGQAVVVGLVQVQIEMVDESHKFADVTDADATKLTSSDDGSARIFSVEAGTGTKWGVVSLQSAAGGALPEPGSLYMVLQLQGDPDLAPVWDWVRCHV